MNAMLDTTAEIQHTDTRADRRELGLPPYEPCGSRGGAPWLCIQTHHGQELIADQHLRAQDFATYLPLEARPDRICPLFPRYLFTQTTTRATNWGAMRHTRGVSALVNRPGTPEPAHVPEWVLRLLWRQCEPNGVIYPGASVIRRINVGQTVQVLDGPFTGWSGICHQSARDRVVLLLGVIGGERAVSVPRKSVVVV